ncbi:MobF family relaxase [Sphingomonas sp. XXL09]|uniref:MobF family relaxase n=1 Tax=Sphingomonas sp. XXL09 TaxID=3457787 RepID=UPI00406BC66C
MLSVASIKSASGAANYFAKDDYYTAEHSSEATAWEGVGAAEIGLKGEVTKEAFEKILNGEMPSGEKVGQVQNRQSGVDLTFSMPKSASILAYVAGDERVLAAHMTAVKNTMAWVEQKFAEGRTYERTKSGEPVRTGNLVYAMFQHDTSRALDPQGHIHVLVANMTKMANGAWQALHNGQLWKNNTTIGAAYHAQFRAELAKIGYETSVTGKHGQFEINGVSREAIDTFSQRRQEILSRAEKLEITSPEGLRSVTKNSRDAKLNVQDRGALRAEWRERAKAIGFDGKALVAAAEARAGGAREETRPQTLERARETIAGIASALGDMFAPKDPLISSGLERLRISAVEMRAQHAVASAIRIHAQREAAFSIPDVTQTALNLGLKGVTASQIDTRVSQLIRDEKLIPGKNDRIDGVVTHVTTPQALATERGILADVERGKNTLTPIVSADTVLDRINAASGDMKLNAGQMAAATMILTTGDSIVAVQGVSGAGKSTMLSAVARVAEQEGRKVIGLAVMKVTADRLGQETGIESRTVSSFINTYARAGLAAQGAGSDPARGPLAGALLFLDEASMIGNDQMKHLTGIVNSLGGQLAEIGDRQQIAAVDAGKAFSVIQEGGVTMARMDENLRQRTEQLRTVAALSNRGAVREAMAVLGDKVIANPEVAKAASEYWLKLSPEQREITAMFSSGRVARAEINIRIQEGLAAEGTLKGEGVAVGVLDKVNIAREQLRYAQFYEKGQVLDLHRAVRELRLPAGTFDVLGVDAKGRVQVQIGSKVHTFDPQRLSPLDQTDPIQLAKREEIKLYEGDKIRWTKNDKERGLNNNEIAKVLSADKDGIKVEGLDGKIHELKTGDPMMERISLAYALNAHAAQGISIPNEVGVMSHKESNLSNQRLFNVLVTRARDDMILFTDNKEKLTDAIERNEGNKTSSLETTGELQVDPGRQSTSGPPPKGGTDVPFNPVLPPDLDRGPEKLGGTAPDKAGENGPAKPDLRNNPSLDLTSIRVNVEPKGPELPFPEKDIGLEL